MRILIHAVPRRMWYVEGFLIPSLLAQGVDPAEVAVWLDDAGRGNLRSCMDAFAACPEGDGGTWHIQDDVLVCRDFAARCRELDRGLVYGFCCRAFGDDPGIAGEAYMPDAWHSFQCVRIPDTWARECAAWYCSGAWRESPSLELDVLEAKGSGDDTFFREYVQCRHGGETAVNVRPNLVEHVDLLLGGSTVNEWRGYWARSDLWDDEDLVKDLRAALKTPRRSEI